MNRVSIFHMSVYFIKVELPLSLPQDNSIIANGDDNGNDHMQTCLAYVNFEGISNSDIRKIFGWGEKEKVKASRLLTSAVEGGYIKVMDPDTTPRYKKNIPYWA